MTKFINFWKLIYFRIGVSVSPEIVTICHQKSPFVTSLVTRSHYVTRMWAENVTTVINVTICDQLQLYLSIWNQQLFFQRTLRIMLIRREIVEQIVDDSTIFAYMRICNFKHSFFNREITIPRLENDFDENNIAQKGYKQHNNISEMTCGPARKSRLTPPRN